MSHATNQLTIRGFNPELQQQMHNIARERNISLNKAALYLLQKGAGLQDNNTNSNVIGNALDTFIGSWSAQQETELLQSIRPCEQIDEAFWQ